MIPFSIQVAGYRALMLVLKFIGWVLPFRTPLLFTGPGSALELARAIGQQEHRKLLIVTDRVLVELGVLDGVLAELDKQGVTCAVYDGVQPDPAIEQIEDGLRVLQAAGCTAVLAVGGGSSIDAAKVIAARATNDKPVARMAGLFKVSRAPLPLFVVPTTSGTGSEVTVAAVVSDHAAREKFLVIDLKLTPKMAALDGEMMRGMPPGVTAATGMDALTHAVEAYLSRNANAETDALSLAAVRIITRQLPLAVQDGGNLEARQLMAMASFYAGCAVTQVGVGYVHAIAHKIGALYHVPHGHANAVVMPHVLEFSKPACAARMADLARAAGLDEGGASDYLLASRFVALVRDFNRDFGFAPTFEALQPADVAVIAASAIAEARFTYPVPRYMSQTDCEGVVRQLLPA